MKSLLAIAATALALLFVGCGRTPGTVPGTVPGTGMLRDVNFPGLAPY